MKTVKELIAYLQACPADAEVFIQVAGVVGRPGEVIVRSREGTEPYIKIKAEKIYELPR